MSSDDSFLEPEYESSESDEDEEDPDELFNQGDAHFDDEGTGEKKELEPIEEEEETKMNSIVGSALRATLKKARAQPEDDDVSITEINRALKA